MDDGLPIVYAGDGMLVSIEQLDDSGSYASIMNSYEQRSAAQDRGQRGFVNYIHVQQGYADPSVNGNVTLPSSYDRVFSNGKGEYVLTNNVSFEPGADWSSIQRTRN